MERPSLDPELMIPDARDILLLENRLAELFSDIALRLIPKAQSFQLMRDDNFVHRRDRNVNDLHLFFELKDGSYFHLRAYTRHMLQAGPLPHEKVFLTGYAKDFVVQTGGRHALRQDWYDWDPETIAKEIISQNPAMFG